MSIRRSSLRITKYAAVNAEHGPKNGDKWIKMTRFTERPVLDQPFL